MRLDARTATHPQTIRGLIFVSLLRIIRRTGSEFRAVGEKQVCGLSDMLNRQKALIYMLEQAARPVSRMELTKWCFLLWREMPSKGGDAFYQFVPYLHGPFSFCLYRESENLVQQGLLDEADARNWKVSS